MDNPEKLATKRRQAKQKHNTIYVLDATIHNIIQIT